MDVNEPQRVHQGLTMPGIWIALLLLTLVAVPSVHANFAVLDATGSISGKVTKADGVTAIASADVWANSYDGGGGSGYARTDAQGRYTITGLLAGGYRVESAAGSQGYVREYYKESVEYQQAVRVPVVAGQTTTGIDFTLEASGGISGKVTKADGVTAIVSAEVWANSYDGGGGNGYARTDAQGRYTITGLPAGDYRVKAVPSNNKLTKLPYADEFYNNTYDHGAAKPVTVTVGQDTPDINFALEVGGSISGRVTDEVGNPIQNADIWADYWAGSTAGATRTDARGYYTIKNLPSGDYRVQAKATGRVQKSYSNALTYDKAMPVRVTAPNDAAGINFSLGPGGTISGTVKDKVTGRPLANVSVDCGRMDGEGGGGATTDQNGNFTITGLPFGRYRLGSPSDKRWGGGDGSYARQFYNSKLDWGSADVVTISAQNPNAANIDFSLQILR